MSENKYKMYSVTFTLGHFPNSRTVEHYINTLILKEFPDVIANKNVDSSLLLNKSCSSLDPELPKSFLLN